MDISGLVRDADKVRDAIAEVKIGNAYSAVAKKSVKVYFPKYWLEGNLGSIDSKITVFAFISFVVDDKYFSHLDAIAMISLNPLDVSVVKIEDVEYYQLSYMPGETIADSITLVKDGKNVFETFNEFLSKSKVPWYMGYTHTCGVFSTALKHAGYNTRTDRAIESFMTANRARDPKNGSKLFRYSVKSQEELETVSPVLLPLTSVSGATSASSRLAGSNMKEGIVESIIDPTTTLSSNDKIMFL